MSDESKVTRDREQERDLVLNPRQYAYILDLTKGQVNVYVGPYKTSLANTDRPQRVRKTDKAGAAPQFEACGLLEAIQEFPSADEGSYVILENPSDNEASQPSPGSNPMAKLSYGRKVNIPGPVSFPLWPGQIAKVVPGHNLRTNQYLSVRAYNGDAATANWTKAVVKTAADANATAEKPIKAQKLVTGQIVHILGTQVSFYIPPTGCEVVAHVDGAYVRNAVTLERLEFTVLLGENGDKRYVRGPAVVFPEPTENFVEKDGINKFRAIELNPNSGLYVKVIAPYEEGDKKYAEGDELFITGTETQIYFPRPEHMMIRYGDQILHYAVAIPEGEARYVLDKVSGKVTLIKGPRMFLPDPRKEVIVRRVIDPKLAALMYPGNAEAVAVNEKLSRIVAEQRGSGFVTDRAVKGTMRGGSGRALKGAGTRDVDALLAATAHFAAPSEDADALATLMSSTMPVQAWDAVKSDDEIKRSPTYTAPQAVTVDGKYDGAVSLTIWSGYAVLLVSKSGARRVVMGPQTVLLEYDETPQVVEFSTGTPKTDKGNKKATIYLRVANNHVSDRVDVVTKDMVNVAVDLAYRVSFEGDSGKWFDVENYVVFLCDHLRSLIRNAAKQHGIERVNLEAISIIRDAILGATGPEGKRTGRLFAENGMRVYDVEVLNTVIGDATIGTLLTKSQHQAVEQTLLVAAKERELDVAQRTEKITQDIAEAKSTTALKLKDLEVQSITATKKVSLENESSTAAVTEAQAARLASEQAAKIDRDAAAAKARQAIATADYVVEEKKQEIVLRDLEARTFAEVKRISAYSTEFAAALNNFGDKVFVENLMKALGPHALLRGQSVADVLAQLVNGTPGAGEKLLEIVRKVTESTKQG